MLNLYNDWGVTCKIFLWSVYSKKSTCSPIKLMQAFHLRLGRRSWRNKMQMNVLKIENVRLQSEQPSRWFPPTPIPMVLIHDRWSGGDEVRRLRKYDAVVSRVIANYVHTVEYTQMRALANSKLIFWLAKHSETQMYIRRQPICACYLMFCVCVRACLVETSICKG